MTAPNFYFRAYMKLHSEIIVYANHSSEIIVYETSPVHINLELQRHTVKKRKKEIRRSIVHIN